MLERRVRCEGPSGDTAGAVDFHDFALLRFENIGGRFQPQLFQRLAEDFLRRGVNQKSIIKHHTERIISDDEPDRIVFIQHCKHKRALDLLSHSLQAVEVEGFLLFKKLHCNVAVRFNTCEWQIFFHAKFFIVPENAVMRERKAVSVNAPQKRMVILVKLRVALCRHTGMSHDGIHAVRNVDFHFSSGKGTLVDAQAVVEVVRNTSRVRAAHLAFSRKSIQNFVLCVSAQALLKID